MTTVEPGGATTTSRTRRQRKTTAGPTDPSAARVARPRPGGGERPQRANLLKSATVWAPVGTSLLGAMGGLVAAFFLIWPNLAPSTENHAEIKKIAVEPAVTLQQYFDHPSVRQSLERLRLAYPERTQRLLDHERQRLGVIGTVLHFEVQLEGLRTVPIASRWSLFEGDKGIRLAESESLDPLPLTFRIEKKEADTGTWEVWIDTSRVEGSRFFVRLELYDERTGARVTFQDSEKFERPRA